MHNYNWHKNILYMHNYIGLKCLRKPSFFPCDLCSGNSAARLVTFSQSHLCCCLTFWRLLPWHFSSFFCNFFSSLWWNFFKLCILVGIASRLFRCMVLSVSLNLIFFNIKQNLLDKIFFKCELEGITFALNCTNFQKISPKETQDWLKRENFD